MANMNKRDFKALSNELVEVARLCSEKDFASSVAFDTETITLWVHDNNNGRNVVCNLTIFKERWVSSAKSVKELIDITEKLEIPLKKWLTAIVSAYQLGNGGTHYVEF